MSHPSRGRVFTIDWMLVRALNQVQPCAHEWVTDQSIAYAIEHLHFDDPAIPHHDQTHRANRIASIALMMEAGVEFPPLRISFKADGIHLHDGHHRLRAHQFHGTLGNIRIYIAG